MHDTQKCVKLPCERGFIILKAMHTLSFIHRYADWRIDWFYDILCCQNTFCQSKFYQNTIYLKWIWKKLEWNIYATKETTSGKTHHSVPPNPPLYAGEVKPPTKFLKRGGGLDRASTLRGGCWKRGGNFFEVGGCNFHTHTHTHTQIKSEIFNDKKSL